MTVQLKDNLIINGESFSVLSHIDALWSRKITQLPKNEQHKLELVFFSTACYRNYVATWKIIDDKLYLVKLIGAYALVDDEPDFVDWYSGTIKFFMNGALTGIEIKSGDVISISEIQEETANFITHSEPEKLNLFSCITEVFEAVVTVMTYIKSLKRFFNFDNARKFIYRHTTYRKRSKNKFTDAIFDSNGGVIGKLNDKFFNYLRKHVS